MRASHARRRTVSADTGRRSRRHGPCPILLRGLRGGSSPRSWAAPTCAPTARRAISASAAARRCAACARWSVGSPLGTPEPLVLVGDGGSDHLAVVARVQRRRAQSCRRTCSNMQLVALARSRCSRVGVGSEQPVLQHLRGLVNRQPASMVDEHRFVLREHLDRLVTPVRSRRQQHRLREPDLARIGSRPEWSASTPAVVPFAPASPPTTGSAHTDAPTTPCPRSLRRMPTPSGRPTPPPPEPSPPRPDSVRRRAPVLRGERSIGQRLRVDLPHLGHARVLTLSTNSIKGK